MFAMKLAAAIRHILPSLDTELILSRFFPAFYDSIIFINVSVNLFPESNHADFVETDEYTGTVKPVSNRHSKIDKTKILMTNASLMKVQNIAVCSPWIILQYF